MCTEMGHWTWGRPLCLFNYLKLIINIFKYSFLLTIGLSAGIEEAIGWNSFSARGDCTILGIVCALIGVDHPLPPPLRPDGIYPFGINVVVR